MMATAAPLPDPVAELLVAVKEVLRISDRKHDAWDRAYAAIAAIESAQPAQPVPEGWKLVPVEPTPEMTAAYLKAQKAAVMASDAAWGVSDPKKNFAAGYRAMLAARPAAPLPGLPPLPVPFTAQVMCGENTALYTADQMHAHAAAVAAVLCAHQEPDHEG